MTDDSDRLSEADLSELEMTIAGYHAVVGTLIVTPHAMARLIALGLLDRPGVADMLRVSELMPLSGDELGRVYRVRDEHPDRPAAQKKYTRQRDSTSIRTPQRGRNGRW